MEDEDKVSNIMGLGKLPKYNGEGSVRKFIREINKRSKIEKWNDTQKVEILKYLCTGGAESYLTTNPELDNYDYDELCKALLDRFEKTVNKTEAYTNLLTIKQNRKSVAEYASKIETQAAEYMGVIEELEDAEKRGELLASIFITGLDPYIKKALAATEFAQFEEVVGAAKRYERMVGETTRGIAALNIKDDEVHPAPVKARMQCWHCGGEHRRVECPQLNWNMRGRYNGGRGNQYVGRGGRCNCTEVRQDRAWHSRGRGNYQTNRGTFQNFRGRNFNSRYSDNYVNSCQCTDACQCYPKN